VSGGDLALQAARKPASPAGLRVAICSDALADRNGVDAYYRDLAESLRARGAAVDLLCPDASGTSPGRLSLPMPGDPTQRLCFPHVRPLYTRLRALAPQVVVAATPGPFGMFGLFAGRRLQARIVAGFHTHLERLADLYWNRVAGAMGRRTMELSNRLLFRYAEAVVVNDCDMVGPASRLGARRVELLGTPLAAAFVDDHPAPAPRRIGRILFVGRLAPEKSVETVLDAAAQCPHLHFTIAGDGPLAGRVRARAAALANLDYAGHVPRGGVATLMDRADLLVLPSHVEAFGTVALEAMARGRLTLVSAQCGIRRWPALGAALFVLREDETLAGALARLAVLDPISLERQSEHAARAARDFNRDTSRHWLALLQRAAAAVPGS